HATNNSEQFCEDCDVPVCSACMASKHKGHKVMRILNKGGVKRENLKRDLEELERSIYPNHLENELTKKSEITQVTKHYEEMSMALENQEEKWRREIDNIVQKLKADMDEMKKSHLDVLLQQEDKIASRILEIKNCIANLRKLLDKGNFSRVTSYRSRNAEFRKLPSIVSKVPLPSFKAPAINTEQIRQQFGFFLPFSELKEQAEWLTKATINTEYGRVRSVTCLSNEKFWVCGSDKIMKLYNLHGELLEKCCTKSGNEPWDIAVTSEGYLVYTDVFEGSVNIMRTGQTPEVIRPRDWVIFNIARTYSGDLLVTMDSEDNKRSKVVRYSGTIEKQNIQFDDNGRPLYTTSEVKYISENRNRDICVSDCKAHAVVVVNQAGKLRFTYAGPPNTSKGSFNPRGITTDSKSRILIANRNNHRIHILDQDGQFVRYISGHDLHRPECLCVDSRDNIFVGEFGGMVKKIQCFV
uniref:B box-type domain-containing protein n=1 Tax=Magallana gigas TaxID=29159 RepID=A0A8W8JQV8_MAGGI